MTKLQLRAFFYQLGCFAIFFISLRYLVIHYTTLHGIWISMTAFVMGTLLAPKFKAMKTNEGEKLYMKWIFIKGVKEIV